VSGGAPLSVIHARAKRVGRVTPQSFKMEQAKADAVIDFARKVKVWPLLEDAERPSSRQPRTTARKEPARIAQRVVGAEAFFTREDDGLSKPWRAHARRVR
jgi:hypothetical protein